MPTVITNENVNEFVISGRWLIEGKMSPDLDRDESKSFSLMFSFDKVPVREVIQVSLNPKKINWVNTNRKSYDKVVDKQVVQLNFKGGNVQLTDEQVENAQVAKLASMETEEEKKAYLAELLKKASK